MVTARIACCAVVQLEQLVDCNVVAETEAAFAYSRGVATVREATVPFEAGLEIGIEVEVAAEVAFEALFSVEVAAAEVAVVENVVAEGVCDLGVSLSH